MSTIRNLPLINGSQNGYAGYNTMVRELSALTLGHIIGFATSPPGSPQVHAMYVVNASATGAWSGFTTNSIAYYTSDNTWLNFLPNYGLCLFFDNDDSIKYYNGSSWVGVSSSSAVPTGNGGAFLTYDAAGTLTAANTSDELSFPSPTATAITLPALVGAARNLVVTIASTQSAIAINLPANSTSVSYSAELVLKFTGAGSAVVTLFNSLGGVLRTFNKLASDIFSVKVHKPAGAVIIETEVRRIFSSGGASDLSDMGKWSTSAAFADGDILVYDNPTSTWSPEPYSINTLRNVSISSPSTNQVLTYNGTSWVNQTPSGSGGGVVPATSSAGDIVGYNTTGGVTTITPTDTEVFPAASSTSITLADFNGNPRTRIVTIASTQATLSVNLPNTALGYSVALVLRFTGGTNSLVTLFNGSGTAFKTFRKSANDTFIVNVHKVPSSATVDAEVRRLSAATGAADLSDMGNWNSNSGFTDGDVMVYQASNNTWNPAQYRVQNLKNVTITTPTNGQVLTYNGTIWVNQTPSGGGSVPATSSAGNILGYNASGNVASISPNSTESFAGTTSTTVILSAFNGEPSRRIVTIASNQPTLSIELPVTSLGYSMELVLIFTGGTNNLVTLNNSGTPVKQFRKSAGDTYVVKVHKVAAVATVYAEVRRMVAATGAADLSDMGNWNSNSGFTDGDVMVYQASNNTWNPAQYRVQNLKNVTITTPTNGQVLTYNGTIWVNQAQNSQPTSSLSPQTGSLIYDPLANTSYTEHFEFSGTATSGVTIDISTVALATGFTKLIKIFRSSSRIIDFQATSPNVAVGTTSAVASTAPLEVSLSKPPGSNNVYCSVRLL